MVLALEKLFSVAGRRVLITGGGRGIGKMMAAGFVANGAHVVVASRDVEALEAAVAELNSTCDAGGSCVALPANLSSRKGCEQLATDFAKLEINAGRCDVLINNAGASWGEVRTSLEFSQL